MSPVPTPEAVARLRGDYIAANERVCRLETRGAPHEQVVLAAIARDRAGDAWQEAAASCTPRVDAAPTEPRTTSPPSISFAWTTPALLAGEKTVTRRDWSPEYARRFRRGMEVLAYDRSPRQGGRAIARLRLTADAAWEPDAAAPDGDWEAEGFRWFWERQCDRAERDDPGSNPRSKTAERVSWQGFEAWRRAGGSSWVIRFEVIEFLAGGRARGG